VNRPVDLQLPLSPSALSDAISTANVVSAIAEVRSEPFNYTINYIYAWADSSLDAVTVTMEDFISKIKASDNVATTHRARVGLHYPRVLQVPLSSTDSSFDFVTLSTSVGEVADLDFRVGVTVW
jgi:hypothetical protein